MIYIFCAPSGSGKSTMVKHLLTMHPDLFELSVSCTTRPISRSMTACITVR